MGVCGYCLYCNEICNDSMEGSERDKITVLLTHTIERIIKQKYEKEFFHKLKRINNKYDINYINRKLFVIYLKVEIRKLMKAFYKWVNKAELNSILNKREKTYIINYNTYFKVKEKLILLLITGLKKRYCKYYFDKLYSITSSYQAKLKNGLNPRKYKFKFKKSIKPNCPYNSVNVEEEKLNQESNLNNKQKNDFYNERLMPYLVNHLNKLRLKRLRLAFEYLSWNNKNNLFCKLFLSSIKNQNNINKKNFLKTLKQYSKKQELILLMRRKIIHKLVKQYLVEINRRNRLLTIVYKIKVFQKVIRKKRILRFIRSWRVYTRYLKDIASALASFEKSFTKTYEKLNDSLFVDNTDEKSIETQINSFLGKISQEDIDKNLNASYSSLNSFCSKTFKK